VRQRLAAPALLASDEVDGAPVNEREDPGAGLPLLGEEGSSRAPDREERFLHGVLCERAVADNAQCKAVGHAAVAVVELAERGIVGARAERQQRLV
jgi:hypothetical protein